MPKFVPIDPTLVRNIFTYIPETGQLTLKSPADKAARRISAAQWQIGVHKYSTHRLVWAWHKPNNPNPDYVGFADDNRANTRIDNLTARRATSRRNSSTSKRAPKFDSLCGVSMDDLFDAQFDYQ